jgi:RimJ/RimL family protein N-acetyltransferase
VRLEGTLVVLEPLALSHVGALVDAASESRDSYSFADVPEGPHAMETYVRSALEMPDVMPFAIVSQRRVVGSTRFLRMEHWSRLDDRPPDVPHVADIGWTWLAASAQRTGMNTEAKFLMLRHAFETWRVFRVAIKVDAPNQRSRRAVESLGAKLDGIRRAERLGEDGAPRDCAWYSIVRDEWPAVKERLEARLGVDATP